MNILAADKPQLEFLEHSSSYNITFSHTMLASIVQHFFFGIFPQVPFTGLL